MLPESDDTGSSPEPIEFASMACLGHTGLRGLSKKNPPEKERKREEEGGKTLLVMLMLTLLIRILYLLIHCVRFPFQRNLVINFGHKRIQVGPASCA